MRISTLSKSQHQPRKAFHLRTGRQVVTLGSRTSLRVIRSYVNPLWCSLWDLILENQDGPKVLHDISFHIKSGERVGVGECS